MCSAHASSHIALTWMWVYTTELKRKHARQLIISFFFRFESKRKRCQYDCHHICLNKYVCIYVLANITKRNKSKKTTTHFANTYCIQTVWHGDAFVKRQSVSNPFSSPFAYRFSQLNGLMNEYHAVFCWRRKQSVWKFPHSRREWIRRSRKKNHIYISQLIYINTF